MFHGTITRSNICNNMLIDYWAMSSLPGPSSARLSMNPLGPASILWVLHSGFPLGRLGCPTSNWAPHPGSVSFGPLLLFAWDPSALRPLFLRLVFLTQPAQSFLQECIDMYRGLRCTPYSLCTLKASYDVAFLQSPDYILEHK